MSELCKVLLQGVVLVEQNCQAKSTLLQVALRQVAFDNPLQQHYSLTCPCHAMQALVDLMFT